MSKSANTIKWIIIAALGAIMITGIALWYFLLVDNIADSVTVEAGNSFSAEDFKIRDVEMPAQFATDMNTLDLSVPGEYPVQISYYGRTYDSLLQVVDTVSPAVTTKNITLFSTQTPKPLDFIDSIEDHTNVTVAFAAEPNMAIEGEQDVRLQITDLGNNVTVVTAKLSLIFDRQPPVIEGVSDARIFVGFPIDVAEGIVVTDDLDSDPVLVIDDSSLDQTKAGEYVVTYTATDICGNSTVEEAKITVIHDTQGPQILGVNTMSMYQGTTISYRSGVIVTDDYDEAPALTIDSSNVDQSAPGTYNVIYTATDIAGNTTVLETTITIKEKKSNYVEESVIYAKADELLAKFIKDDMTTKEKVEAVFRWVKNNCSYTSSSDKTDRLQAAWQMMTRRVGDCYNYYAICALFFDRLGIPNIAVRRSSDSPRRTRHFWNMVSIDGGENYYHFDACPVTMFSTRMCLVTDETLKNCERYAPGYYTMDEGIYPATPQDPPE